MPAIVSEDLQNQIVSAVRKGNEATVGRIKTAVGSVKAPKLPVTPKLPEGKLDVAKIRQGTVDYAGKLPTPVDVVEGAFGLFDRAFEQQRKITSGVISKAGALRPGTAAKAADDTVVEGKAETKPAAAKKPAKAAAAK
ncbi:MAG: hypothetical protein FWE35_00500 [Streptosporangiales bacterium]|nr:hypothetical protein [Streptosporangiales bacterium]